MNKGNIYIVFILLGKELRFFSDPYGKNEVFVPRKVVNNQDTDDTEERPCDIVEIEHNFTYEAFEAFMGLSIAEQILQISNDLFRNIPLNPTNFNSFHHNHEMYRRTSNDYGWGCDGHKKFGGCMGDRLGNSNVS